MFWGVNGVYARGTNFKALSDMPLETLTKLVLESVNALKLY